jgi:hypothetical protein
MSKQYWKKVRSVSKPIGESILGKKFYRKAENTKGTSPHRIKKLSGR